MPSAKVPSTVIEPGKTAGPQAVGGSESGVTAGLLAHLSDPVDAHDGASITYDGGPTWADGTTNPPAEVESQLDKIVSDLASSAGSSGGDKIGVEANTVGTVVLSAGTLQARLNDLQQATNIYYSGGSAWFDGTTNPGVDVEAQLDKVVTDLINTTSTNSGADRLGCAARTSWLDATANTSGSIFAAIDKVITDLNTQGVGGDGAAKVGAYEIVSSGSFGTVVTGSVRSQLTTIVNNAAHLSNVNNFSNTNPINYTFAGDVTFTKTQSGATIWDLTSGEDFRILLNDTTGRFEIHADGLVQFAVDPASGINELTRVTVGGGPGVTDSYGASTNSIVGASPALNEARPLTIQPGAGGGTGAPLILRSAGPDSAGDLAGPIILNFQANENNGGRRTYLPTQSYALADGGPTQILATELGGTLTQTAGTENSSVVLIEAYVFMIGWSAGSPVNSNFSAIRRAHGQRNNSGTYSIIGAVTSVHTEDNWTPGGDVAPVVTIVANGTGFHIQVTPGSTVGGSDDQLWWGYLIISPFEFNNNPDNNFT